MQLMEDCLHLFPSTTKGLLKTAFPCLSKKKRICATNESRSLKSSKNKKNLCFDVEEIK